MHRILENVNHGVTAETFVAIRRSQPNTETNQTAALNQIDAAALQP
jgi:hypothetical protein